MALEVGDYSYAGQTDLNSHSSPGKSEFNQMTKLDDEEENVDFIQMFNQPVPNLAESLSAVLPAKCWRHLIWAYEPKLPGSEQPRSDGGPQTVKEVRDEALFSNCCGIGGKVPFKLAV